MEVDPLKPLNIPLSSDTVLWFEFLLKPQLLTDHLESPNPVPTPIELVSQFLSITREIPIESTFQEHELQFNRKEVALKILTLKIISHLKWNLETLEKNLPVRRQVQILSYLCSIASGKVFNLPSSLLQEDFSIGPDGSDQALQFALTFCHLWIVRMPVVRSDRVKINHLIMQNIQEHMRDEHYINTFFCCIQKSIDFLIKLEQTTDPFKILTKSTFIPLDINTEHSAQNFDSATIISKTELRTQINFDLCSYFVHAKMYDLAKHRALKCKENLELLKAEYNNENRYKFCIVSEQMLYGLLLACGLEKKNPGLFEKMIESDLNKFINLIPILREDNLIKEIPIVNRRMVELDVELASLSGAIPNIGNTLMHTIALNTIRSIIDTTDTIPFVDFTLKFKNPKDFQILVQAALDVLNVCNTKDKMKIKEYFLNILLTTETIAQGIENSIKMLNLFSDIEISEIKRQRNDMDIDLPTIAMQTDWKSVDSKNPTLDRIYLERQLITCFTPNGIRKYLVKLVQLVQPKIPLWGLFQSWNIPIPLHSTLMSLQEGFLQDFGYLLIGKSRELRDKKDYGMALNLLNALKSELKRPEIAANNPNVPKLSKLVAWEILLYQIFQTLEEWPNKPLEHNEFVAKCKQCIASLTNGDNIIPRITILENCASMLLNLNDWSSLVIQDKRLELISSFAAIGLDKEKFKGSSKKCRECWDYVLRIFSIHKNEFYVGFNPFIKRLRDPFVISIVMSLLSKLHNILKDESNLELNAEYMFFWPTAVSNPTSYSIKLVSETLNTLLQQSLKYYPNNLSWIKLKGDLEFVNGNYETAMKYYVNALVTSTEYGTRPQRTSDDFLIRRMIKCSANLGCFMQATVLCQFLSEIDYGLAFKNISEKTSSFSDAMDAYYTCIWDPTLLEFIVNLHTKKGEHTRKLQAISYMGQLELNANNNEEIKFEASDIRKTHFIRALTKQYLL